MQFWNVLKCTKIYVFVFTGFILKCKAEWHTQTLSTIHDYLIVHIVMTQGDMD